MKSNHYKILMIEDTESLGVLYQTYLERSGNQVSWAVLGQDGLDAIAESTPDLVLLDLQLPDMQGMDILRQIHNQNIDTKVVVMTAHGSVDNAVEALRLGATDFLVKPIDAERLNVTVANVLDLHRLGKLVDDYKQLERDVFEGFIGRSLVMQSVYRIIESAAPSKATVFITGESGTGKELCAQAVHHCSPRAKKPFIALNCAAIPKELIESEIFGHVKGAFTGASSERKGAASRADGGTLFLDEICEMDLDLQSKLLRFIQTGSFEKVGSSKLEHTDIRFVCATNREPLAEVKQGRFREDLYYRLHVIPLPLPSLKERGSDILLIANHFLQQISYEENKSFKRFSSGAKKRLLNFEWPGNVRQLENVVRNIVVLNDAEEVDVSLLPPPLDSLIQETPTVTIQPAGYQEETPDTEVSSIKPIKPLWLIEKEAIEKAIGMCEGNIPRAAALLEVSPSTIYRKKQAWDA